MYDGIAVGRTRAVIAPIVTMLENDEKTATEAHTGAQGEGFTGSVSDP